MPPNEKPPSPQANAPPKAAPREDSLRQATNSSTWNSTPLLLQKKAEVFLNREVYPCLQKFPKSERFSLCQDIKQTMSRVIRGAILSNVKRGAERVRIYEDVDAELKYLLVLTGIARSQKYITEGKAMQWQTAVEEMGRMLGGLIKAAKGQGGASTAPK